MAIPVLFIEPGARQRATSDEARVLSFAMYVISCIATYSQERTVEAATREQSIERFANGVFRAATDLWPAGGNVAIDEVLLVARRRGLDLASKYSDRRPEVIQ